MTEIMIDGETVAIYLRIFPKKDATNKAVPPAIHESPRLTSTRSGQYPKVQPLAGQKKVTVFNMYSPHITKITPMTMSKKPAIRRISLLLTVSEIISLVNTSHLLQPV